MRINRLQKMLLTSCASVGMGLLVAAVPALGQTLSRRGNTSVSQTRSATEINESLQRVRENLNEQTSASQAGDSRIGPNDLLNITVFEAPEMNSTVRVSVAGQISLPLLGAIHASGLTIGELESMLQATLRQKYMKDPHVGVFLQELQSHPVSVVGAVKMPGVYQIRGTKTVIEVLSMAQGLADDAGDAVFVMHASASPSPNLATGSNPGALTGNALSASLSDMLANGAGSQPAQQESMDGVEEINLKRLLESTDSALNVAIRPGDIVKVPRAGIVYVVGEVNKPGGFVLQNNESISVLQALALAQGTTHTSAISQARIIRTDPATGTRTEIPMNLGKIFSGKKPDALLQPKDIVFVPNSATKSVLFRSSEAALQTAAGVAIYKW